MYNLRVRSKELWDTVLMNVRAEDIIRALDESPMPEKIRSEIAYRILRETNHRDTLVDEILDQYRNGFKDKALLERLVEQLARRRVNYVDRDNSLLHIAWGVLPEEGLLDGYLAEYYYEWAKQIDIPEEKVSNILLDFRSKMYNN